MVEIAVISANRSERVPLVIEQFGDCSWYVPLKQKRKYKLAGAKNVVGVSGNLPMKGKQLNKALDSIHEGGLLATVDDDIIECLDRDTKKSLNLREVVESIAEELMSSDFYLAGPYSGTNTSWAPEKTEHRGRVPGAMMVHKCSKLRFDTHPDAGIEDLDFVINHHVTFGGVLICGQYCLANHWAALKGGYAEHRASDQKENYIERMINRWEKYGCKFMLDEQHKNGYRWRIPWKKLTEYGK